MRQGLCSRPPSKSTVPPSPTHTHICTCIWEPETNTVCFPLSVPSVLHEFWGSKHTQVLTLGWQMPCQRSHLPKAPTSFLLLNEIWSTDAKILKVTANKCRVNFLKPGSHVQMNWGYNRRSIAHGNSPPREGVGPANFRQWFDNWK